MSSDSLGAMRAIIFDMDGLMVDTEPLARLAWEKVLGEYGSQLDEGTYARIIGLRLEDSSRLLRDTYNIPVSPLDLAEKKQCYLAEIRERGVSPMPGLYQLIDEVERRRVPWAVATSSNRADALTVLTQLNLFDACRAIATGDEVRRGKPAPDIYLLAAFRLGVSPLACLALEDSAPGVLAAKAASMVTIAVPSVLTKMGDFSSADYVFTSLYEVIAALDKLLRISR